MVDIVVWVFVMLVDVVRLVAEVVVIAFAANAATVVAVAQDLTSITNFASAADVKEQVIVKMLAAVVSVVVVEQVVIVEHTPDALVLSIVVEIVWAVLYKAAG